MASTRAVVAHVTTGDDADWRRALRNVANLLDDGSVPTPPDRVTVVFNGGAVERLLEGAAVPEWQRVRDAGVRVAVCENTLAGLDGDASALAGSVATVPSGVGEAVRRQRDGAAYLRLP